MSLARDNQEIIILRSLIAGVFLTPKCLRCDEVTLSLDRHVGLFSLSCISYFDCPSCSRQYALRRGRKLTYRWLHPISLPLYDVLFERKPLASTGQLAESFNEQWAPDQIRVIADEIEHELNNPTQKVRDILNSPQSEKKCRKFLRKFVDCLRASLPAETEEGSSTGAIRISGSLKMRDGSVTRRV